LPLGRGRMAWRGWSRGKAPPNIGDLGLGIASALLPARDGERVGKGEREGAQLLTLPELFAEARDQARVKPEGGGE